MAKKKTASAPPPPPSEAVADLPEEKKRSAELRWIPIDLIVPNSWNPNSQDDATFDMLQNEIAEIGQISSIEVIPLEDGTYRILGGEHRWRAAKKLGKDEMACMVLTDKKWSDQDLQKFVTVRLNVIHGKLDPDKFLTLYKEMASKYGEEAMQRMMGYADSKQFQRMLGWVKKGLKQSLPKEMAQQVEDSTKEVKSVADLSNIIQDLFNKYGETVNESFMVFAYGKQQHIYVAMDAKMRRSMEKVIECCRLSKQDINEFMKPVLDEFVRRASIEIDKKNQAKAEPPEGVVEVEKSEW